MKRLVLTDGLIREALSPDPHTMAPAGLLAQITADVARTPQRRTLRFPALPQSRRVAWVLVGAATLLALLGALFIAGGSRNPLEAFLPPAPSQLTQQLPRRLPVEVVAMAVEIEAVSADEAWASDGTERLWHRTAAGWAGPIAVGPTGPAGTGIIRDLARMPDGRIVVSADSGVWVGDEAGWTNMSHVSSWGVSSDAAGMVWAATVSPWQQGLRAYRQLGDTWSFEGYSCPAGGNVVATAADGSVWTGGIDYTGATGVARLTDGSCEELDPWGDGAIHDVLGLATDREGRVAITIMDVQQPDGQFAGGRIMTWAGERWTTLRDGVEVRHTGWNGLSYGPDGTLWAAFDDRLWRYSDGAESLVRADVGAGPVSVSPDGAVWFVSQDAETGAAFVDRLLPAGDTVESTPAPTASPQAELMADPTGSSVGLHLLGIDDERAWAARSEGAAGFGLWGRTAEGWTGPISVEETAIYDRMTAVIRGIADLGDGRLAIATDTGLWVGSEGAWTRAWEGAASDVAMAPDGRLWVSGSPGRGESSLRALRETGGGWQQDWSGCRAGGNQVAVAADGSVWTSGITYSSGGGVARAKDGTCEEMFPLGEGNGYEVPAIAASPTGAVAVYVMDPLVDDQFVGAHVVEWQDGRWTELRGGKDLGAPNWHSLAYTPDGALWAVFRDQLYRYANGTWQAVTDALVQAPISAAFDGTVWYVRGDGVVDRLLPGDPRVEPVLQHDAAYPHLDGYSAVFVPVTDTEQWAVGPGSGLGLVAWHRTATGWTGPYVVEPDPAKASLPRSLVVLPDGRMAVSTEHGLWVGGEREWTRVREGDTAGVAVGGDGTLWTGAKDESGFAAYTETARGWEYGPSCSGGGGIATADRDGVVWSADTGWQSPVAVLRVTGGRCEEIIIAPEATAQVLALAPDGSGGVAAVLGTQTDGKLRTLVVHWDDQGLTTLRDMAVDPWSASLAYGRDGTLWMQRNAALSRYADGAWTDVTGTTGSLHTSADGTIWFLGEDGYRTVDSLEIPGPDR